MHPPLHHRPVIGKRPLQRVRVAARIATLAGILISALGAPALAQVNLPDPIATRSLSGQFVINSSRLNPAFRAPVELAGNTNYIELETSVLVVSCERIKQTLQRELSATDPWRGKIFITLKPMEGLHDPVDVVCEQLRDHWNYHITLSQLVERQQFTRAIVQTLLLERANRRFSRRSAEIPTWLVEGMTEHLLRSKDREFILPPPHAKPSGFTMAMATNSWRFNPLAAAHETLNENPPLTLAELSWPAEEQLSGTRGELYRRSAQLFVTELMRLNNGGDCLRQMVDELGQCYNWQTAFFRAFNAHFTQQLDLEKWWALQVVHFTGRSPEQLWTVGESWRQLDQLIRASVEVRRSANDLPARTEVTLQVLIGQLDYRQQAPLLRKKLQDLDLARLRTTAKLIPLLDEYRQTLTTYLQNRERVDLKNLPAHFGPRKPHPATIEAIRQLDALDAKRLKLRPTDNPVADGTAGAQVAVP